MTSDESLDPLIDRIYAAALNPETWHQVIAEVGRRIGATSGTSLWFGPGGTELIRAEIWNIDPEALSAYQQHYLSFCPRYRASHGLAVGAVYDDRAARSAGTSRSREYYNFMDRYELGLARIALAEKRPDLTIGMNFYNRAADGFSDTGAQVLQQLAPHFRRACNMTQALADVTDRAALGDAWFQSRTASMTLDAQGNVLRMNSAAQRICSLCDGISTSRGRLVAASRADCARLDAEIARALGKSAGKSSGSGDFLLIARPSGLPAFAVSVVPIGQAGSRERAIVTIAPTVPELSSGTLQRAFGLTPSEASIAVSLCKGRSPEEIALDRGVSLHTIRSQIKTIHTRLDVRSQTELVSRLTAASLGVRL